MATYSCILAWKIPWTEEPDWLQSVGSQRAAQDLATTSYYTLCNPMGDSPLFMGYRLLCPWDFPGKNTGVGCHFLLQGIFPTQGLNLSLLCLPHCRGILYLLSPWKSPLFLTPNINFTSMKLLNQDPLDRR